MSTDPPIEHYIIEHPTRGVLLRKLNPSGFPSFSPTKLRDHAEVAVYYTFRYALLDAAAIPGARVLRSPRSGIRDHYEAWSNGDWIVA
jgi:hypothetical protein